MVSRKVFLYGYMDSNFGDDVMVTGLLEELNKFGHTVYMAPKDKFVADFLLKYKDSFIELPDSNVTTLQKYGIQAFINIGGSQFPHDSIKEGIFRYKKMYTYNQYRRAGIAVCIVNCNIGAFKHTIGTYATNNILKNASYISCRDTNSFNYIKKYNKSVKQYADYLFSVFNSKACKHTSDLIGLSTYTNYRASGKFGNDNLCKEFIKLIDILTDSNKHIRLFSFDGGYNSDLPLAMKVFNRVKRPNMIEIVSYDGNIDDFSLKLAECSYIVGVRFHSIVFALSQGIPLYPIIYDKKTEQLLTDIEFPWNDNNFVQTYQHINSTREILSKDCNSFTLPANYIVDSGKHISTLMDFLATINWR